MKYHDTTIIITEIKKSKLMLSTSDQGREQRNPHSLLVRMQKCKIFQDILAVSCKVKHNLTICSFNWDPGYLPTDLEGYVHTKTMHMNIYSSFINNYKKLGADTVPINR